MSILVGSDSRVVVTGATGREGAFHAGQMRDYGTKVVAGVTPGRGGQDVDGLPILNSVREAVTQHGANTAIIFVPPAFAGDSICECADAGCALVICITEGLPTRDAL